MRQTPNVCVVVYLVEETFEHLGCLDGERARDTDRLFKNNCSTKQDKFTTVMLMGQKTQYVME